jgi:hypothetical protein
MKATELLSQLDPLSFPERQRTLTRIAREKGASQVRALLESLNGDLYQAHCALTMASAIGDSEFLVQALAWSWPQARKRAAALLVDISDIPRGLVEATFTLDMTSRQAFFRKIRRVGREDMAALLVAPVAKRFGPKEASWLLAALSEKDLDLWLPRLAYRLESWRTLAGRHPEQVLTYMRGELEKQSRPWRSEVWSRFSSALDILAQKRARALLGLAQEFGSPKVVWSLFRPTWGFLASREPDLLVELLLSDEYRAIWKHQGLPAAVLSRLRFLDLKTRLAFVQPLAGSERHLERALQAVAPSERKALFDGATSGLDLSQQLWGANFMKVLPHAARAREAERMLALPSVSSSLEQTVSRLGQLPPDKSDERLRELVRNPKVETRALVRGSMVGSAGLYRTNLETTLSEFRSLKNEADPVRFAALQALSFWPYSCINEEHIPHLRAALQDVCGARDTSEATRSAFRRMALRWIELAKVGSALFDFGLEVLRTLTDASAALYLSSIRNFSEDRREAILSAMLGRVDKEMKRENFNPLFALCNALGDRVWEHPSIEQRLQVLTRSTLEWEARKAICYWLYHPKKRGERAEELLRLDASTIAVPSVLNVVNTQRQDLLDPYLEKKAIKGRFLSGDTIYVLPIHQGFERWLPRQQKAFAEIHALIYHDQARTLTSRAHSLRLMDELCFLSDQPILAFLSHPQLAIREAALGATRSPEVLLAHLNTQEARVAAYRLGRVVRDSRPDKAREILERGLDTPTKLTSKKELYRLFGLLREFEPLAAAWREEGQHRDLLVAILHALQEMLDLGEARELLLEAFQAEDHWLVRAALAVPRSHIPKEHRVRWVEHLQSLVKHPEPTLALLVWTRLRSWAVEAPERLARTAVEGLVDLDSTAWRQSVELLLLCAAPGDGHLAESALGLVEQDSEVREQRDLPARQRLRHLIHRARAEEHDSRRTKILKELATVQLPEAWQRFAVRACTEPWADMAEKVETFEEMEALIGAVKTEVARPSWEPEDILKTARTLAGEESPTSRRLAVDLLALAGGRTRWNEPSRELLEQLRRDHYQGVAERAALLVTRPEP